LAKHALARQNKQVIVAQRLQSLHAVRAQNACSGVSIALSSLFANILLHEGAIPLGSVKVVARLLQKHIW
jgi:hypothetical protein